MEKKKKEGDDAHGESTLYASSLLDAKRRTDAKRRWKTYRVRHERPDARAIPASDVQLTRNYAIPRSLFVERLADGKNGSFSELPLRSLINAEKQTRLVNWWIIDIGIVIRAFERADAKG